jgi:hypothetical protein
MSSQRSAIASPPLRLPTAAFVLLAAGLMWPASAMARQTPPPPPPPAAPADPAAPAEVIEIMGMPVPGPRVSEDIEPAKRAIERMVVAYRTAPALIDDLRLQEVYLRQPQPEVRGRVILGPGTDCAIESPRSRMVALGDRFYFESESIRSRYVDTPLNRNLAVTMREVMQTRPGLGWHINARFGETMDELFFSLSFGLPEPPTITGYERATLPDGRDVHRVTLQARSGWSVLTIDAETDLLLAIDADYEPAGAPIENFRITRHMRSTARVLDELPEPIAFDPRDRTAVSDRNAFTGRSLVGAPVELAFKPGEVVEMPDLFTLEGMPWSLQERRGRVQVIVAWNLGSVQFRREFVPVVAIRDFCAQVPGDVPVDMWLLNTREKTETTETGGGKWDAVYEFWSSRDYEIECLFDDTDAAADRLGIGEVPVAMVIDARGRLTGTQGGLDSSWPELVRELINTAVRNSADPE